jgi:hypothetical protein
VKVAAVTGQNPDRDVALLFVFYGTGLTSNEVAKLLVLDYLMADCWFALNPDPGFASNIDPPFEPVFGVR